ncbi:MAG: hypothetical protein M0Z33_03340 [Actinomycetota bacterium]|nr:hypothetical protein [Actinomycetota bacterium]
MDQQSSPRPQGDATPIFGAYRRGYDPEQVDRYVADQQRRLDEATQRASEAERKLAAAVGQLRELHRRVAVLESEDRSPQPAAPLDTLGERVQRILQEAWEGAYALRQSTEQEMAALRERTAGEAESIVVAARQRARAIEEEIERRRNAYLARVEEDRSRALAQISHLHHKRDEALGDLMKVKGVIEATVSEMSSRVEPPRDEIEEPRPAASARPVVPSRPPREDLPEMRVDPVRDDDLARTLPVQRLEIPNDSPPVASPSELVRNVRNPATPERSAAPARGPERPPQAEAHDHHPSVFDFEEDD